MLALGRPRQPICLRCRYRITLQTLAQARQKGSRPFSISRPRLAELGFRDAGADRERGSDRLLDRFKVGAIRAGSERGDGFYTKSLSLNLNALALDVSRLGQPANILRLGVDRQGNRSHEGLLPSLEVPERDSGPEKAPWHTPTVTPDEILQHVEERPQRVEDSDVIVQGINQIRDEWLAGMDPHELPTVKRCRDVHKRLEASFTKDQLQDYLQRTQDFLAEDYDDLQGFFKSSWCSRSAWYRQQNEDTTTANQRKPGSIIAQFEMGVAPPSHQFLIASPRKGMSHETTRASSRGKPWIIDSILRYSWRLRTREELQLVGDVDVTLNPKYCQLLQRFGLFEELERRLNVQIVVNNSNSALIIEGLYQDCALAFAGLYAPLTTISTRRLQLAGNEADHQKWLSIFKSIPDLLSRVAQACKVIIEPEESSKLAYNVTFLAPRLHGDQGEDDSTFETTSRAFREVYEAVQGPLLAIPEKLGTSRRIPLELSALPAYLREIPSSLQEMPWSRLRTVSGEQSNKTASGHEERPPAVLANIARHASQPLKEIKSSKTPQIPLGDLWQREPVCEVTLGTGFVAFAPRRKESSNALQLLKGISHRTFTPAAPGGLASFERLVDTEPIVEQSMILRLEPEELVSQSTISHEGPLPDLEIKLVANDLDRGFSVQGLTFSLRVAPRQLLLPTEVSDAIVNSCSTVSATEENPMEDMQEWANKILVIDGHVATSSIPRTLELDVPVQATKSRSQCFAIAEQVNRLRASKQMASLSSDMSDDKGETRRVATAQDLLIPDHISKEYVPKDPWKGKWLEPDQLNDDPMRRRDLQLDREFEHVEPGREELEQAASTTSPPELSEPGAGVESEVGFGALYLKKSFNWQGTALPPMTERHKYKFTGLEYHSNLHAKYRDSDLTYRIVDAGEMGGRYEQIVVQKSSKADVSGKNPDDTDLAKGQARARRLRKYVKLHGLSEDEAELMDWLKDGVSMIKELGSRERTPNVSGTDASERA